MTRPAGEISVGEAVRHTEPDLNLADCDGCVIAPACGLTGALAEALGAFLAVLDRYTIADVTRRQGELARLLGLIPADSLS